MYTNTKKYWEYIINSYINHYKFTVWFEGYPNWEEAIDKVNTLKELNQLGRKFREEVASEGVLGGLTNFKGLYPWEEKKLIENIILDSTELENTIANFENKLKAIVGNDLKDWENKITKVGSNEQEVINLRKKKEELRKTLKEKEQQIITLSNHKCDTPEGKELNLWKEKVVELTTEKDKLQKKIKDFELSGDDGENLDNLTPEQLKHKIYNTRKEITKLKSEIGKNNNSNPEGANYGHWILGGMGILIVGFLILLVIPKKKKKTTNLSVVKFL